VEVSVLLGVANYDYQGEFIANTGGAGLGTTQGEVKLLPALTMGSIAPALLSWDAPPAGMTQRLFLQQNLVRPR
jgi:hypothetical protein